MNINYNILTQLKNPNGMDSFSNFQSGFTADICSRILQYASWKHILKRASVV